MIEEKKLSLLGAQLFLLGCFLPFYNQHPIEIPILFALIYGVGWIVLFQKLQYEKWFKLILLLGSLGIVIGGHGTIRGLEPGLGLLSLVTAVKTIELARRRDRVIFSMMSLLVLVGHLLNVDSLAYVAYMVLMSGVFFAFLFRSSTEDKLQAMPRKYWRDLTFIFLLALPQTFLLFIFFPRFYVGNLSYAGFMPPSKVGFIDELDPGAWSDLVRDRTPMFRAIFPDERRPSGVQLYWRGAVLQRSEGFSWSIGNLPDDAELFGAFRQLSSPVRRYRIDYASNFDRRLFTLSQTYQVELQGQSRSQYQSGGLFRAYASQSSSLRYLGVTGPIWENEPLPASVRAAYLQVPEVSARMQRFVSEFMEETTSARERVDKLLAHFRERSFVYTLDAGRYTGRYPEDEFFFQRRRGFCEHYASVTALILRLMDVPTRIITGFQGGDYNPIGDYFVIRGEDAHAWVEAYIAGEGWVLIDPVRAIAPYRIEYGAYAFFNNLGDFSEQNPSDILDFEGGLLRRIGFTIDAFYYQANLFFTTYRDEQQRSLFQSFGLGEIRPSRLILFCLTILLLFSSMAFLYFRTKRGATPRYEQIFSSFCSVLEKKLGVKKAPSQSAHGYYLQVRELVGHESGPLVADGFKLYQEIKYGKQLGAVNEERLKSLVKKISRISLDDREYTQEKTSV